VPLPQALKQMQAQLSRQQPSFRRRAMPRRLRTWRLSLHPSFPLERQLVKLSRLRTQQVWETVRQVTEPVTPARWKVRQEWKRMWRWIS
jgi:hypothetical protein